MVWALVGVLCALVVVIIISGIGFASWCYERGKAEELARIDVLGRDLGNLDAGDVVFIYGQHWRVMTISRIQDVSPYPDSVAARAYASQRETVHLTLEPYSQWFAANNLDQGKMQS